MMWRLAKLQNLTQRCMCHRMFDTTQHESDTEFDIEFNQRSKLCQKCSITKTINISNGKKQYKAPITK